MEDKIIQTAKEYRKTNSIQSELMRKRWAEGKMSHVHSDEWKRKVSEAHKRNPKIKENAKLGGQTRWRGHDKNPSKLKNYARTALWKKENKDMVNYYRNKRQALKKGSSGTHSYEDWLSLKAKHLFTCLACGRQEPEISLSEDHVVPLSKGGSNLIENIQPLCIECNCKKHTSEWDYRKDPAYV